MTEGEKEENKVEGTEFVFEISGCEIMEDGERKTNTNIKIDASGEDLIHAISVALERHPELKGVFAIALLKAGVE